MAPIDVASPVWKTHVDNQNGGQGRYDPGNWYCMEYNGRVLKYLMEVFGTQPSTGYPLYIGLHGGGTATDLTKNDASWQGFFSYWYRDSIKANGGGVYIAARGISSLNNDDRATAHDEWNLHSQPESYGLLQSMISNLFLPEPNEVKQYRKNATLSLNSGPFVDSNRVYLLGFSAGGDGVYQLTPRISDRLAAAVAGGGHYNNVSFTNLANMPLLLQCGERDDVTGGNGDTYKRARVTIEAASKMGLPDGLTAGKYTCTNSQDPCPPQWYHYECHIIKDGDHNAWARTGQDNKPQKVLTNLASWYAESDKAKKDMAYGSRDIVLKNINPIAWVNQFTRQPCPESLVWDLSCRPPTYTKTQMDDRLRPEKFFHWLYLRNDDPAPENRPKDIIFADYGYQWVRIKKPSEQIGILLNESMVSFNEKIIFYIGNEGLEDGYEVLATLDKNQLKPSETLMAETLSARGDPNLVFSALITFQFKDGGWWLAMNDKLV